MNKFFVNFLRLTRPLSNVKNIALIAIAFYLSQKEPNWFLIILSFLSASFFCSAIYAYNTINDYESDKINKNKSHYSQAVEYFGEKKSLMIVFFLLALGLLPAFFINIYFLICLLLLLATAYLYSSKATRFKEKFILDILFGASLTFLFRFSAFWFVFSYSIPPILAVLGLVFAKSAGYLLYKDLDYKYQPAGRIKNSITILSRKTKVVISVLLWLLALLSFVFLCLNYYFKIKILGFLPPKFLLLIPFAIPPIIIIYLLLFDKIKIAIKNLRLLGFVYFLLVIIFAFAII